MHPKKVYIETHGCQMNVDDSLRMAKLVAPLAYHYTERPEDADLILINTCSVREKASHKAHSAVGKYYPLKALKPSMILGLAGCQAQVEGEKFLKRFDHLDFVLGPDQIASLPEVVEKIEKGEGRSFNQTKRIKAADFQFVELVLDAQETMHSAFVTIMKGCDNFCSFCIVPFVRGREVSRSSREIIDEIKKLTAHGVKEVTLLGQNVNSYGSKNSAETSFASLLRKIAEESPLERIRFTTSHPKDVGQDLMEAFRDLPVLAKHIHLPVQAGSNSVLQRMYRTYTREEYLKIIEGLKKACPDIAISTDLIVGFPGETDEDFKETLSLMEAVQFDAAFSFCYSPRPHTTAARYFEDNVDLKLKEERLHILQDKQKKITFAKNEACVGKYEDVLLEGVSRRGESLQGRSTHNRMVHLSSTDENLIGKMLKVKIIRATPMALIGEI